MEKDLTCSEEIIDKRYRNFMILCYPEDNYYNDLLFDLKGSFKNYAYIIHNPEFDEKKEHVHFILSLENPRTIESIASRLNINPRLIQPIRSLRASCRYLIHKDDDSKTQYSLENVIISNSFKEKFYGAFDDLLSDTEILQNIYSFIDDNKNLNHFECEMSLTIYVSHCGYDRVYKRFYNSISKYIAFRCIG